MKKRVIALMGTPNMGKSETVRKAYELLKAKYPKGTILFEKIYKVDITVIMNIENVKIGIESQEDPNGRLVKTSLALFVKEGCQVIICTTRIREYGQTVVAVKELQQKYEYDLVRLQQVKAKASEQEGSNLEMAKRIIAEAEKIINA